MASSTHAADWYEHLVQDGQIDPFGPEVIPYSDNFYGWAKVAYQALGFVVATGRMGKRQLEVVQIRIGALREIAATHAAENPKVYTRDLGAYISARDLQRLVCTCIEARNVDNGHGVPFQVFYGISDNARKFWGIANARRVIGYAHEDDSEVKYAADIARHLSGGGG